METPLAIVRALATEIVRLSGSMHPTVDAETAGARVVAGTPALAGEPLLDTATLLAHARAIGASVPDIGDSITAVAAALTPVASDDLADIALSGAWDAVGAIAARVDIDASALLTVLDYGARPALLAAAEQLKHLLDDEVPSHRADCPMCGAPPLLAELSGKDGARSLRCGRCGARWRFSRLACAWCGAEHTGAMHDDREAGIRQADYCDHCHGYLKAVSVLSPLDYVALLETDMRTAALDFAAIERGYARVVSH